MLKRFEKLQYMVIGAVLMAVGIGIGSIFTPPLNAQRINNVFDNITCRSITVVDENGKKAIVLGSKPDINGLTIFDHKGNASIAMSTGINPDEKAISIFDSEGKYVAIKIVSQLLGNSIAVNNIEDSEKAIVLSSLRDGSHIGIYGRGNESPSVSLGHVDEMTGLSVNRSDGITRVARMVGLTDKNVIELYDENGSPAVHLQGKSRDNYLGVYDFTLNKFYRYTGSKSPIENPSFIVDPE